MKKLLLSTFVLAAFFTYSYYSQQQIKKPVRPNIKPTTPPLVTGPTPSTGSNTPAPTPRGKYIDGTYTGPLTDAFYGPMQVRVVIVAGRVSDVLFLKYPNDRRTSEEINQQAMPLLEQEVIRAQSAKIDGVTGATQTSDAFIKSLDAALKQAT